MPLAYIGLGSNLGDRIGQMRRAVDLLQQLGGMRVVRASPIYQNRAVGMGETAADFLNAVVEVSSDLEPMALLEACLAVEERLGRHREVGGWVPRTIDLDLLAYGSTSLQQSRLTLPHPRIAERDFVAVPLADLAPELQIGDRTAAEIAQGLRHDELSPYHETLLSSWIQKP